MNPYPLHSRVRVGDEYGTIVHVALGEQAEALARPFYHIAFDGDKTEGIQNKRIVLHEDIKECWDAGAPVVQIPIDAALFEKFLNSYCVSELGNAQQWDKKNPKRGLPVHIPNPVEWNSRLRINVGGAYDCENNQWDYLELLPLVPLVEYAGEMREPTFKQRGYQGYRVVCEQGEFVISDEPVAVCSTTPVRIPRDDDEEMAAPKQTKKRAASQQRAAETESVIEQLSFMEK